ncbi:MAG: hypothetical protein F4Y78_05395 [Candidatus Dadabacteria bacterium]|nr:hypothetical protein [Candidatus Dadabacteria bacterium]
MRTFIEAAKTRIIEVGFNEFRKEAKVEGDWKQEDTYLILLELDGFVLFHANDRSAEDRDLSSYYPMVAEILASREKCIQYDDHEGVSGRYACSVVVTEEIFALEVVTPRPQTFILIAGLHTAPQPEEPFEELIGSNYVPEVTADKVKDAETLKLFVDGALEAIMSNFNLSRAEVPSIIRFRRVLRREGGPWNVGDIYLYIMQGDQVVFHGDRQELEDDSIRGITDSNGCVIAEEIRRVIAGEERECKSLGLLPENPEGYLEYLWDNPEIERDEDPRALESREFSPGFTPKLGYVKSFTTPNGIPMIVGSGVYPVDESDGGCAVAGSDQALPAGFLAMFLLVGILGFRKKAR